MEQIIYSGYNSIDNLNNITTQHSPKKIFLVSGKSSFTESGLESSLHKIFSNIPVVRFNDFGDIPDSSDIEKACMLFRDEKCDFVIGAGGGSAMDIAKAVSILATQDSRSEKYLNGEDTLSKRTVPSVMIPTTSGTGSESTHFSVYYINKTKHSLEEPSILPDYAILDPEFTISLPPYITAVTGLDALCQAIESFWSIHSTDESREFSKKAIKLCLANIEQCVNNPDKESRNNMLLASNYAGRAINISKTTAAHAVSYPLTSFYNIPHGHAVALTIPNFLFFNSQTDRKLNDPRGKYFVADKINELIEMLGATSPSQAKELFISLMHKINIKTHLSDLNISKNNFDAIIKNGFNPDRVKNNPVEFTEKDLLDFLEDIK